MLHYAIVILYLGEICFTGLIYFIVLIVSFVVLLNWIEFGLHRFQWEKRASVGFYNYFVIAYYLLCKGISCSIDMVWLLWHGVLYLLQTLQTQTIKSCAFFTHLSYHVNQKAWFFHHVAALLIIMLFWRQSDISIKDYSTNTKIGTYYTLLFPSGLLPLRAARNRLFCMLPCVYATQLHFNFCVCMTPLLFCLYNVDKWIKNNNNF